MRLLTLSATALLTLTLLSGCGDHDHDHEDGHGHDSESHAPHGDGHDGHGDAGDGHSIVITHFTPATELFVEFPALVAGGDSPFAAHLTRLKDYKAVNEGTVTVTLSGGGAADETFSVAAPASPGIFRPIITPKQAGQRHLTLRLQSGGIDVSHDLGQYTVYATQEQALAAKPAEAEGGDEISYLKEQQWQVDFALAEATVQTLRASLQATGTLRPRADGEVYLSASSSGHLRSGGSFPYVGMKVERGQRLATIAPRLGGGDDLATLTAALDKARTEYAHASHERQRLEKLWNEKAIALHRLHEAESLEKIAKAELDAAEQRHSQSKGEKGAVSAGIPVLAPISGVLAQVSGAAGQYVHEGDPLFHIVNVDRLWLEARIAEADIGALQKADGAWFTVEGFNESFNTLGLNGRTIALGGQVDAVSRTVPLIFEFSNPGQRLRAGMFANARVFTGENSQGVTVPASAIYDDGGQEVVYVMLGGESFQRRMVRTGIRDGEQVEIKSGVQPGERVVSRGAYLVRLASASPAEAGHGHAH